MLNVSRLDSLKEYGIEPVKSPRYPKPTEPAPNFEQLESWVVDSVVEATDGCDIEPDGICQHGHPSWLLYLGLI